PRRPAPRVRPAPPAPPGADERRGRAPHGAGVRRPHRGEEDRARQGDLVGGRRPGGVRPVRRPDARRREDGLEHHGPGRPRGAGRGSRRGGPRRRGGPARRRRGVRRSLRLLDPVVREGPVTWTLATTIISAAIVSASASVVALYRRRRDRARRLARDRSWERW